MPSTSIPVSVATDVVARLRDYLPVLEDQIRRFAESDADLTFEDRSPVDELTYQLVQAIPVGSVWFGITRLDNVGAWQPAEKEISRFVGEMRRRVKLQEIAVWRLFYFASDDAYGGMRRVLEDEAAQNINVRYQIRGVPPEDISLVWAPADQEFVPMSPAGSLKLENLFTSPAELPLTPLCALSYSTAAGILLTKAVLSAGTSQRFVRLVSQFEASWNEADTFSAECQ